MATRSTISAVQNDGSVKSVYCHFDGYLSGVGLTLLNHFNSLEKANEIIALGSISSLQPELAAASGEHSFDKPQRSVTIAYHRDRGDEMYIEEFKNIKEFKKENQFEEYNYVFRKGFWLVLINNKLTPLTQELIAPHS